MALDWLVSFDHTRCLSHVPSLSIAQGPIPIRSASRIKELLTYRIISESPLHPSSTRRDWLTFQLQGFRAKKQGYACNIYIHILNFLAVAGRVL
jgi:hypothetical protein